MEATEEISLTAVNESSATEPESTPAQDAPKGRLARRSRRTELATIAPKTVKIRPPRKPVRTLGIVVAVTAMVATVALPAVAAVTQSTSTADSIRTVQQEAADGATTLVVASDADATTIKRDSYAATTPQEIEQKKAEEAALARAKAAEEAAAAAAAASASASSPMAFDLSMVAPGSGAVRWPLGHINYVGDGFMARGGEHHGVDLLTDAMTPIFAAADGVVSVSSESFGGYGVGIVIDSNINGQHVSTLYGHMTYGTRQVQVGQTVTAGQLIGFVGSTGWSTAPHLHFEVEINGSLVDPYAWLQQNAG